MPDASYEREENAFYASLGVAITQWAHVENALFEVFAAAIGAASVDCAAAAFYSQISFRAKLEMADAVLAVALKDKALTADWGRLFRRLKKRASQRNALAHHEAVHVAERQKGSSLAKLRPMLKPRMNKPSSRVAFMSGSDDLDTKDILSITREFSVIRLDLEAFRARAFQPARR